MIIITGMLLLLTIPFFIYAIYKTTPIRKHIFIMYEIIAAAVLLFCSTLVVLDIPYIIKGGLKCDEAVVYTESQRWGSIVEIESGKKYWSSDGHRYGGPDWLKSLKNAEEGEVEIYVLPHTRLIFKVRQVKNYYLEKVIENGTYNSFIHQFARIPPYDLHKMRELSMTDLWIFVSTAMLWYAIYKSFTK